MTKSIEIRVTRSQGRKQNSESYDEHEVGFIARLTRSSERGLVQLFAKHNCRRTDKGPAGVAHRGDKGGRRLGEESVNARAIAQLTAAVAFHSVL